MARHPRPSFFFTPLLLLVLGFCMACVALDPERLVLDQGRQDLLDEILNRDKTFRIRRRNESRLIALLDSEDSRLRLAVVKLMGANPSPGVYNALVSVLIDEDSEVVKEATRILLGQWDKAEKAVLRALSSPDTLQARAAVRLIRLRGDSAYAPYLLMMLDDSRPELREQAARGYGVLGGFRSSWFQARLASPVGRIRRSAVEIIPLFRDSRFIPFLMDFVSDPDESVVSAALFGLSDFGVKALPPIEKALKEREDRPFRLKLLEVIDGGLNSESIPLLISLLGDGDSLIAQRAERILFRMGSQALPLLVQGVSETDFQALERAIHLVVLWQDPRGIPFLVQTLGSRAGNSGVLSRKAKEGLLSFGEKACEALVRAVDDEGSKARLPALELLVETRSPSLVRTPEGEYSVSRVLYLFESLDRTTLDVYLEEAPFSPGERRELKGLYKAELNAAAHDKIKKISNQKAFPYFFALRDWEQASLASDLSRKQAFEYIHNYFTSNEDSWLRASRQSRESSGGFDREAERALKKALAAKGAAGKEDTALVESYLKSREALVEGWRGRSRGTKKLLLFIFLNYSLDIKVMLRDYDYFRTLPPASCPWPKGIFEE